MLTWCFVFVEGVINEREVKDYGNLGILSIHKDITFLGIFFIFLGEDDFWERNVPFFAVPLSQF